MSMPGLNVENRPQPAVPSLYIQTGLLFLIGAAAVLVLHTDAVMAPPRHNAVTLVLTHMLVLGFGTLITFGALDQMIPVILGRKIGSARHGRLAYALFVPGLLGQLAGFAVWQPLLVAVGGALITLGTLVFTLPYLQPLWARMRTDVTAPFILSSLIQINVTVLFGIALAVQLKTLWWPWLFWQGVPFHLILGGLGWFTQIIVGVSYKLIPMFITTTGLADRHVRRIFFSFNIGLVTALFSAACSWVPGTALGLLLIGATCAVYIRDVGVMLNKRIRPRLSAGMQHSIGAVFYLIASAVLAALLLLQALPLEAMAVQRWVVATGLLFAFGWVGGMIVGMLSKIVPMLVWLDLFSDRVGQQETPTIAQLIDETGIMWGGRAYQLGLVVLSLSVALGSLPFGLAGASLFLIGVVVLTGTLFQVWSVR